MKQPPENRKIPAWLRIILMGLLIAAAGWAFYLNSLNIIERLTE
jgi:hypothetical protein